MKLLKAIVAIVVILLSGCGKTLPINAPATIPHNGVLPVLSINRPSR